MKLISKYFNLCDDNTAASQTNNLL